MTGNPFVDVGLHVRFTHEDSVRTVSGFYDGEGTFRARFMPETLGEWRYETESNCGEMTGKTGSFVCVTPSEGNHGPVRVAHKHHFAYAEARRINRIERPSAQGRLAAGEKKI